MIAKYYLVDGRNDDNSLDYQASIAFEEYLHSIGLKTKTEKKFGLTALRWAALKAGLGIIRKNNFFYTNNGSWIHLEAWLVDKELELKHEVTQKPCSEKCNLCIEACPTKSLFEPYTMSLSSCVSCLTTLDGNDLVNEPNNHLMGSWLYGCDACQDACPHNSNKWIETEEFPKLSELMDLINLENIIYMDYDSLQKTVASKFWYIEPDRIWKWKVNALNVMKNCYKSKYDKAIETACNDSNEHVRNMAKWVKSTINTSN